LRNCPTGATMALEAGAKPPPGSIPAQHHVTRLVERQYRVEVPAPFHLWFAPRVGRVSHRVGEPAN
jgi:hypothetical protein